MFERTCPLFSDLGLQLLRVADAGGAELRRSVMAGVGKPPRKEPAGSCALKVQRALWGLGAPAPQLSQFNRPAYDRAVCFPFQV